MKYELILFDADETLFDFKKSERVALENTITDLGLTYDAMYHLPLYKEVNTRIWRELEEGKIQQSLLKTERFRRYADRLNIEIDASKVSVLYEKHLSEASFLYDESLSVIQALHSKCQLVIITNGLTSVQKNRIGQSVIAPYFKTIIISEEVKAAKPNRKIFEIALDSVHFTDKSKVLIVGDSLTSDIQGGINFGIDTCWFNPNHRENKTQIRPTYKIADLYELLALLR
ncbi:YjjG family noncanonical pyrimidine nucleotidase [Fusibacter ferrireducens]|uniref:Noncanonical pyrimidine nucleotidase, YjjG family n=1 Tax=Fusibacter ferrireducens TaxID=2785058 RepID=A0ABR9ZPN1_9FIRM|nr:YjjG family noncanonical pyrimidine nucleotidase [Fusibacter ferrireducens]MBF4692399.1 noncanonical pyrimidine nucleotidase, YjjG family [Fusibacter ferrireducens]